MSESYPEFVESMKSSLLRSIISKNLFGKAMELAGDVIGILDAIEEEAYSVADSYFDSEEGIGSSDMNAFVRNIFSSLGEPDIFGWNK